MHKLTAKPQKVNAEVIGLDVHKRIIVYSHLNRKGEEIACGKIGASREDLESFLREAIGRKKSHVVFEASCSSLWVYALAASLIGPDRVHVAQASKIRVIANSLDKNDFNDAWWLAYLTQENRLPEAYVPPDEILELRIACRERHALVRRRAQVMVRLRSHLAQIGIAISASSLHSDKAKLELDRIIEGVHGVRRFALSGCRREMEFVTAEIAQWEAKVADLAADLPAVQALHNQAPGVGVVLAAMIIGEAGDINRFHRAKSFARYAGLTPTDRSSGGQTRHGSISRQGSPYLRWALTQATVGCLRARSGPAHAAGEWIRAKQSRLGQKAKGRVAGARKIAETIWRLFHYGECFDPALPFGGKVSRASS